MPVLGHTGDVIGVITDNVARSTDIVSAVKFPFMAHPIELGASDDGLLAASTLLIVDVSLSDRDCVELLRAQLAQRRPSLPILFVSDSMSRNEQIQANFLGAREIVKRSRLTNGMAGVIAKHTPERVTKRVVNHVQDVNQDLFKSVLKGEVLPVQEIDNCADLIAETIAREGLSSWLGELKKHHSYTHRHSMHVNGLAVAFGLAHGMREMDVRRLATGAHLHDIGKARIPLEILDKPHLLNTEEKLQMRKHPEYSAEVLINDGQFDPEVADVARHHHEYLDGSGYPDGLAGNDISDLVRIVTIADVFSALVDQRSYKHGMPAAKAYAILSNMTGKLDLDLVRAFEPIALDATFVGTKDHKIAS